MKRYRIILRVIKHCGLGQMTAVFLGLFLACSIAVMLADPQNNSLKDGLWYSFQAVTTIGYGDIITHSDAVRVLTICLSIVSIFYLALLTGGVVSYCSEVVKLKNSDTIALVIDKLENLEDLPREELAELSTSVKRCHDSLKL